MRDPRRSESGDARPDRTDPPAADVAEGVGDPADGAAALPPASTTPTDALVEDEAGPSAADTPDAGGAADVTPTADADLADDDPDDDPDDDLLDDDLLDDVLDDDVLDDAPDGLFLDPLLSDEPIDLAAVRADDALIDALAGDDLDTARDLVDPDDPLIAMLAAWAASARPDDPAPPAQRPALSLVPEQDGADPAEAEDDAEDAVPRVEAGAGTGAVAETEHTDDAADPDDAAADLDAPTVRLDPAVRRPQLVPPAGPAATADDPGPAAGSDVPEGDLSEGDGAEDGTPEPEVAAADPGTTPLRLFPRRRGPGTGRRAPDPFRRAAVVIVAAVLGVSVAAATGGTARPGEPGFAMTRVFFAERAKSLEAAQVVAVGLERARVYLRESQPALAAQELADVQSALPDVSDEDGHNHLADQQQVLATAVAMAPPDPRAARRADTPTTTERPDPDTSVLAEAGTPGTTPRTSPRTSPGTTTADGSDVVTSPSKGTSLRPRDPATSGSSSAVDGAAAPTTTVGGTTDTASVTAEPTTPTGGTSTETSTGTTKTSGGTTTRTTPADPTTTPPTSRDDEPDDPTSTTKKTTKPDRTTEEEEKDSPETSERARDDDTPRAATGSAKVQPAAHHVWGVPEGGGTGRATVAGSRLTGTTTVDRPTDAERVSRAR